MYRTLVFVALSLSVSESCRPPPCHWSDATPIENYYQQVVDAMIQAHRKMMNYCNQQGGLFVKEDHKPREYSLFYPNADGDAYEIKVKNRVILVRAENCNGAIADVRVLPPYVDPRGAYYKVDGGMLIITFPYKFDPTTGGSVCIPPDPNVIRISPGNSECTNCNKRPW